MDNPTPSSSSGGGGAAAAANASSDEHRKTSPATAADFFDEEHTFDDILLPVDLFDFTHGLDAGDGCYVDDQAAIGQKPLSPAPEPAAEQQPSPAPEHGDDERLVMYYQGQEYVFDSVQPQKIENIFHHLNGQEMIPQSIRPQPTNLVRPITVPEDFDRFAALTRYREKKRNIKFIKKADYSARKEVALRCTNCGESSDATPMMRHAPNGTKSFCNACGLMWENSRKIRKIRNPTSGEQEDQ
uniref:Tify domain-containing protein n=1 Tax=Oryza glumipatula TaxID=40148 RepID=A0A0E0BKG2_9ORYZ